MFRDDILEVDEIGKKDGTSIGKVMELYTIVYLRQGRVQTKFSY